MKTVVLDGDDVLTTQSEGESGLSVGVDGAAEEPIQVDGDADLNIDTEGDVTLSKRLDGEAGTIYRVGNVGGGEWGSITGDIADQTDLQEALDGKVNVEDLGTVDLDPYDYDVWAYLDENTLDETGLYTFSDSADGFSYFIKVERVGSGLYQEYWYTEEGAMYRYARQAFRNGDAWDYSDPAMIPMDSNDYYNKWEINERLRYKVDTSTLNNYYTKDQVDDMLEGFTPETMIETTWANLRTLRDSGKLVKGAWYRITDYNFVTTKLGVQSGNHQFDIVILAISESMLSESGYACRHAGDRYFEREVTEGGIEWLYTLYVDDYAEAYGNEPIDHADDIHSNDTFCDSGYMEHPDTGDVVPILYKTDIEEYGIDDPDYEDTFFYSGTYDLDGDEYDMWAKYEKDGEDWVFLQQYALTPVVVEDGELIVSPIPETKTVPVNMNAWELKYCLDNDKELFDWAATDGRGVIYYLKDEFGNEAPYDFKNVMFQRKNITATINNNVIGAFRTGEYSRLGLPSFYGITCGNTNYYYYTFDTPYNAGNDSSLFGESTYNVMRPYIIEGQRILNNIVLGFANNNYFGSNCHDITMWNTVQNNNFEQCLDLLFAAASEVTAKNMRQVTLYSVSTTQFDYGCRECIGNMISGASVGAGSSRLNFGLSSLNAQIGIGCSNINMGNYCYNNKFSFGVANCTLGNFVSYCSFDTAAVDITLPNYVRYCTFESDVHKIQFTTSGGSTSRYIQYVTVKKGVTNLTVAPTRGLAYETIYYKTGRVENAV